MREWLGRRQDGRAGPRPLRRVARRLGPQPAMPLGLASPCTAMRPSAAEPRRAASRATSCSPPGRTRQGGGKRTTRGHYDVPMRGCTIALDGRVVVEEGRIVDPKMIVPRASADRALTHGSGSPSMLIDGQFAVAAAPPTLMRAPVRRRLMASCLPGCESLEQVDEDRYRAVVAVALAGVKARFDLQVEVTERDAERRLRDHARRRGRPGQHPAGREPRSRLAPNAGGTLVSYRSEVAVTGRLGRFALGMMKKKAQSLGDEFAANLRARLDAAGGRGERAGRRRPPPGPHTGSRRAWPWWQQRSCVAVAVRRARAPRRPGIDGHDHERRLQGLLPAAHRGRGRRRCWPPTPRRSRSPAVPRSSR